jgi:hypothetical protein
MDLGLGLVGPNGKLSEVASGLEMAGRGDLNIQACQKGDRGSSTVKCCTTERKMDPGQMWKGRLSAHEVQCSPRTTFNPG